MKPGWPSLVQDFFGFASRTLPALLILALVAEAPAFAAIEPRGGIDDVAGPPALRTFETFVNAAEVGHLPHEVDLLPNRLAGHNEVEHDATRIDAIADAANLATAALPCKRGACLA
jgi:hypothetical protein